MFKKFDFLLNRKTHTILNKYSIFPSDEIIDKLTKVQFYILRVINNLTLHEFQIIFKNGQLSPKEKVLIFDILRLFNSLEVDFNRIIGLEGNSCSGISAILRDNKTPPIIKFFQLKLNYL